MREILLNLVKIRPYQEIKDRRSQAEHVTNHTFMGSFHQTWGCIVGLMSLASDVSSNLFKFNFSQYVVRVCLSVPQSVCLSLTLSLSFSLSVGPLVGPLLSPLVILSIFSLLGANYAEYMACSFTVSHSYVFWSSILLITVAIFCLLYNLLSFCHVRQRPSGRILLLDGISIKGRKWYRGFFAIC